MEYATKASMQHAYAWNSNIAGMFIQNKQGTCCDTALCAVKPTPCVHLQLSRNARTAHGVICTLRYNTLRWQQKSCRAHNERVCPPKAFMKTLAPRNKFSILVGPKCALLSFSPSLPEGSTVGRHSTAPSITKEICCTQDYCFVEKHEVTPSWPHAGRQRQHSAQTCSSRDCEQQKGHG